MKRYHLILIVIILGLGTYFLWQNRSYLTGYKVPDNKYYAQELTKVDSLRRELNPLTSNFDKVEKQFIYSLNKQVFPFWYGTKWAFNGITRLPNEGGIACGYFVTTTLEDMGVPLERVKLARAPSEEMIRTLTDPKNIYHVLNSTLAVFEEKLAFYGKGLYIIGLDNHTGFILVNDEGQFFIHSSGRFPFCVVKEKVADSKTLRKSKYKVLGKISADEAFLKRWISNPPSENL